MPIISAESFATRLKSKTIDPLYLLFGDEELLIEEGVSTLLSRTVDDATRDFNYDRLDGTEATGRDIVERASSLPIMAERRTLLVRNIDKVIGQKKKDDGSGLIPLLASPPATTTIILTVSGGTILSKGKGKPRPPYDGIVAAGTAVQYKKLYDRDLPSWAAARIKSKGKRIDPEGLEIFVAYAGGSLRTMSNEIDKLFAFLEDRVEITGDDVRAVVGVSKQWNVFELQKAIGLRDLHKGVEIIERMIRAGEPAPVVITMLTRYFTILWRALEIRRRGGDKQAMARALGVPPFFLDEYLAASSRYGLRDIQGAFATLLAADLELKSSGGTQLAIMSLAVTSIIRGVPMMRRDPRMEGTSRTGAKR